ncbi:MAG: hypothetical protein ACRDNW_17115 [Trebonia sp.]
MQGLCYALCRRSALCGEALIALGGIQAKLAAAYAGLPRRFDAAGAHGAGGYGSSSAWLAAKAQLAKKDARAVVLQVRQLASQAGVVQEHALLHERHFPAGVADVVPGFLRPVPPGCPG